MIWQLPDESVVAVPTASVEASPANLRTLVSLIDLTTLESTDTPDKVRALCARALEPGPGLPSCAAVCVYPAMVPAAAAALRGTAVPVAAVAGGFPSGQLPAELKAAEAAWAVEHGAGEIDLVINRGLFLTGDYAAVEDEVAGVRRAIGATPLKVILETGELPGPAHWRLAADIALAAGADVVKTSTGKCAVGATPEAAGVLCEAAAAATATTGTPRGFKAAGGVRTPAQALAYQAIVATRLGREAATDPHRFRIGASSLLDGIVAALAAAR